MNSPAPLEEQPASGVALSEAVSTPADEVRDNFGFFQEQARKHPVLIARDGRPETVLLSYEEFARLKRQDRRAYGLDDLPRDLAEDILGAEVPPDLRD